MTFKVFLIWIDIRSLQYTVITLSSQCMAPRKALLWLLVISVCSFFLSVFQPKLTLIHYRAKILRLIVQNVQSVQYSTCTGSGDSCGQGDQTVTAFALDFGSRMSLIKILRVGSKIYKGRRGGEGVLVPVLSSFVPKTVDQFLRIKTNTYIDTLGEIL